MLSSLFGDLGLSRQRTRDTAYADTRVEEAADSSQGFAATAILETTDTSVNTQGQMVDRLVRDLVVSGSAAQAMRDHFAEHRAELDIDSRVITLYDPTGVWAPAVVRALSDAGGQPIERLHLRDQTTLRTLATIERTRIVRRLDETLKIYHADVSGDEIAHAEVPMALMERSHMTAVILGPMAPSAVDEVLHRLQQAAAAASWHCPAIVFMLPPSAVSLGSRITKIEWPEGLQVSVLNESLISTSAVWNALLGAWNRTRESNVKAWAQDATPESLLQNGQFPIRVADLAPAAEAAPDSMAGALSSAPMPLNLTIPSELPAPAGPPAWSAAAAQLRTLDAAHAALALQTMLRVEGVLACAVVDSANGHVVARERRPDQALDLDASAAACTQILRAHRLAARSMGLHDLIDEITVSAGARQQVMRSLVRHPGLFMCVVLDRHRTNPALVRVKMAEADRALG